MAAASHRTGEFAELEFRGLMLSMSGYCKAGLRPALFLAIALFSAVATAHAQSEFYVDASDGSDRNSGQSPDQAWQSLTKVNRTRLQPGDTVFFRRSDRWTGQVTLRSSGRAGQPITFAAYGHGPDPVIAEARNGIDGNGHSHIVIRDLQFRNMTGPAIRSTGSTDWRIDHVTIDRTGLGHDGKNREFAGIQFWDIRNLIIENSTLTNVRGDGIWVWEVDNLKLLKNRVEVCQGESADNVHLYKPHNYEIRGNFFSMEGETDSGKGNVHSYAGDRGLIEDNVFRGLNYGVGITDNNLTVRNNRFFNHDTEKWAAAIIVSEVQDVKNNMFVGNKITDANMGIYILNKYTRENFQIRDNVFEKIRRTAVVIESPISGELTGNVLSNSPGADLIHSNSWLVRGQRWDERANVTIGAGPSKPSASGQPR